MALVYQGGAPFSVHREKVRCEAGCKENCVSLSSLSWNSAKRAKFLCLNSFKKGLPRRFRTIVAASPPTEDAVIAAEPLTKEDLVGYLASGCKPKEQWRWVAGSF